MQTEGNTKQAAPGTILKSDQAMDMWSLGCVLYQVGRGGRKGKTLTHLADMHLA